MQQKHIFKISSNITWLTSSHKNHEFTSCHLIYIFPTTKVPKPITFHIQRPKLTPKWHIDCIRSIPHHISQEIMHSPESIIRWHQVIRFGYIMNTHHITTYHHIHWQNAYLENRQSPYNETSYRFKTKWIRNLSNILQLNTNYVNYLNINYLNTNWLIL